MKDRTLATRYARALLAALPDPKSAEMADDFLQALAQAIRRSRDLRDLLANPTIPRGSRKAVLIALVEGRGLPREVRNFLCTVTDHGRSPLLDEMADAFHELKQEALGEVTASLVTAEPLAPDLLERATRALSRLTGRDVRLTCTVEPSLLGGAVARIGSRIYDGSLRAQLELLRRRMVEE